MTQTVPTCTHKLQTESTENFFCFCISVHYILHFSVTHGLSWRICNWKVASLSFIAPLFRHIHKITNAKIVYFFVFPSVWNNLSPTGWIGIKFPI